MILVAGGAFRSEWLIDRFQRNCRSQTIRVSKLGPSLHSTHDPSKIKGALIRFIGELCLSATISLVVSKVEGNEPAIHGRLEEDETFEWDGERYTCQWQDLISLV